MRRALGGRGGGDKFGFQNVHMCYIHYFRNFILLYVENIFISVIYSSEVSAILGLQ